MVVTRSAPTRRSGRSGQSAIGVFGDTLGVQGGGSGWPCYDLVGADVLTADGGLVRADETEHADLFWALRGGGGNFGIVTSFDYRLHEV